MTDIPTLTWITGGTAGIGLATARACNRRAAAGDRILVTGRSPERFEPAVAAITAEGPATVEAMACDHADLAAVEAACAVVKDHHPQALRIVANVGWNPVHSHGPKKTQNLDAALLRQTLEVNVIATAALVARMLPVMRSLGGGAIVLVGSQAYKFGIPGQLAYNVSKAALVGIKNTVAAEYGARGVHCHLVNPGIVQNERTEKLRARTGAAHAEKMVSEDTVAATIIDALGLGSDAANGQEIDI